MIQTSKPHWVGTRDGKSTIPSAFALRQLWPSNSHKSWKKRPSSSIGSWSHFCSGMAFCSPGCSIWMKLLCDLSFRRAEPLNSATAEQFQWSLAAPRRGAIQSHSQSPPMAKNFHLPWSSKVFTLQETSLFQTLFENCSTRRAGWMKKVMLIIARLIVE